MRLLLCTCACVNANTSIKNAESFYWTSKRINPVNVGITGLWAIGSGHWIWKKKIKIKNWPQIRPNYCRNNSVNLCNQEGFTDGSIVIYFCMSCAVTMQVQRAQTEQNWEQTGGS